jgi:hypothetical protein
MNDPNAKSGDVPQHPQERNLRDGMRPVDHDRDFDSENVPDPVSFTSDEGGEADRLIEAEDLDRLEQMNPKADDADDIKDR